MKSLAQGLRSSILQIPTILGQASPDFSGKPAIKRVIFVATPHRGSSLAAGGIGAIAIWLIRLPLNLLYEIPETWFMHSPLNAYKRNDRYPNQHPGAFAKFAAFARPRSASYPGAHHSIIGDRGRGNTPNSSDGVVPYWSSHLSSAESEKIVPTGHEAWLIRKQSKRFAESCYRLSASAKVDLQPQARRSLLSKRIVGWTRYSWIGAATRSYGQRSGDEAPSAPSRI